MLKDLVGALVTMNPIVASLLEFNEAFEIPKLDDPGLGSKEMIELRIKLLVEEVQEYAEAARKRNFEEVADALGDMLYILCGTILSHGMQDIIEDIFREIQRSNMSKLGEDGKPIYRDDGKVMKGPEYFRPDITSILNESLG